MQFNHFNALFFLVVISFIPISSAENAIYTCYTCSATTKSKDSNNCLNIDSKKTAKDTKCLWCSEMYERKSLGKPDEFYKYERRCVKSQKLLPTAYNCSFAPSNTKESRGMCWCEGDLCNRVLEPEATPGSVTANINGSLSNSMSFVVCLIAFFAFCDSF